jgi:antitoxin component YwqK of YwqJK toxin-antitoxin module
MEREYKKGKLNGLTKYYYRGYYPTKDSQYYENGPVYGIRNYEDGKLTGEGKDFYNNDKVAYAWNFKDGKLNGEAKSYSKDGKILGEANYIDGELNGVVRQYLPDGTLEYSAQFKDGKLNGTESYYYPTMKMMLSLNDDNKKNAMKIDGNYNDGRMDGHFRTFYETGQLESDSIYQNDKLVNTKNYDKMGSLVFDYDYNCDESPKKNVYRSLPMEAEMFLKSIEVSKEGVSLWMKDNFQKKYKVSPIYLSKYFDDKGHLFISKDADLNKYRLEGVPEHNDLKQYAFIAAYREEDKNEDNIPFQYLYFGKFEDGRAVFLIRKGFPAEKQQSAQYIYVDKVFEDVKKCNEKK